MLKLFISYSHFDEHFVQGFIRHTELLERNGFLSERWYDREISAGDDFMDRIDEHLLDRDIVCCLLSSHYIASESCQKELRQAIELRNSKGILVIPIILSPCAWLDYPNVNRLLAMPIDGKPITSYDNEDVAWLEVYDMLKKSIEEYINLQQLRFSQSNIDFLNDASLLTKAHGNKNELKMDDIYIHPEVEYRDDYSKGKRLSFKKLIENFSFGDKIAIVGEDQSGKTTLAKKAVTMLRHKGFIPIYIRDENELLLGDLKYSISQTFKSQYDTEKELSDFDKKRIVPIIDDFYKAKHKEKVIQKLEGYEQLIIIVDTIFDIDLLNEKTIIKFKRYTIKQLKPSLRNELIRKWISVSETDGYDPEFINGEYLQLDERMTVVDEALGKVLGKLIMPAYPFFILTLLSNYDSINKPLNEEITSQGYCYQALIILFLNKVGVRNEKLDTYINFLTEFAQERYLHKTALSQDVFNKFLTDYSEEYNFTEAKDILLKKLKASRILHISSLGNYDFSYPYLYYFFAGKYFAEHLDNREGSNMQALKELEVILDNLHKNENAYITIFMVHHSKDNGMIQKILCRANDLFKDFVPATMSREEMLFFKNDSMAGIEIPSIESPHKERRRALVKRDEEEIHNSDEIEYEDDEAGTELSLELRRSFRTVQVLGRILKNRYGSIKTVQLNEIFESGMNVHLRLITSFFELIKKMITYPDYGSFIVEKLIEDNPKLSDEEAKNKAQTVFWNINFGFIVSMIQIISTSLGSKNTIRVSDAVCSKDITPIKFIIQQDIAMRFTKNIRLDEILDSDKIDMSEVAKKALVFSIAHFCRYNRISPKDRSQLLQFGIKKHLLTQHVS